MPTTPNEIINIVSQFQNKTSAGYDEIPMHILKLVINHIAYPISSIINHSLAYGIVWGGACPSILSKLITLQKRVIRILSHAPSRMTHSNPLFINLSLLKYEDIYLRDYESVKQAREGINRYFAFYNNERLHQSLAYRCPRDVYLGIK